MSDAPVGATAARPVPRAIAAGLATGGLLTWNVSNVGAVADPLADAYGVSLAVVGLLTTALFVTHLAAQLPAGIWSDRFGPHRLGPARAPASSPGSTSFGQEAAARCSRGRSTPSPS